MHLRLLTKVILIKKSSSAEKLQPILIIILP